jgi:hypothetical protein
MDAGAGYSPKGRDVSFSPVGASCTCSAFGVVSTGVAEGRGLGAERRFNVASKLLKDDRIRGGDRGGRRVA